LNPKNIPIYHPLNPEQNGTISHIAVSQEISLYVRNDSLDFATKHNKLQQNNIIPPSPALKTNRIPPVLLQQFEKKHDFATKCNNSATNIKNPNTTA
jgi:hypothetical protein